MTTTTADAFGPDNDDPQPNRLRPIAFSLLAVAVLAVAATALTNPAEAGSCTGIAALQTPLLPVVV